MALLMYKLPIAVLLILQELSLRLSSWESLESKEKIRIPSLHGAKVLLQQQMQLLSLSIPLSSHRQALLMELQSRFRLILVFLSTPAALQKQPTNSTRDPSLTEQRQMLEAFLLTLHFLHLEHRSVHSPSVPSLLSKLQLQQTVILLCSMTFTTGINAWKMVSTNTKEKLQPPHVQLKTSQPLNSAPLPLPELKSISINTRLSRYLKMSGTSKFTFD